LDKAQREHEERAEFLNTERARVEKQVEAEDARWQNEKEKLAAALRQARG
jgi:colicin import membrane protein